jgi:Fe2+ or Zn2+ uptake regulation protein
MADMRFADVMQQERERLHQEREQIFNQQHELQGKLADINRELSAIDAYEAAKTKTGKAGPATRQTRGPRQQQARRGSRREALLQLIKDNPTGLARGEILERMGLKGDKAGEMSVSNALTALSKANQVSRKEGRYFVEAL